MRTLIRKGVVLLLSALMLYGSALAMQSSVSLSQEEIAYLEQQGPIVFVSQTSYPPFEFRHSDGSQDGMTIELVHWLATEVGFRARFIDMSFYDAQQAIQSGVADVLTSFFYSTTRDQLFDFTTTLFHVPASIFVTAQRPDIVQIKDLAGKRIAMQRGDYAQDFLVDAGIPFEMIATTSFAEATAALIEGRADAIIGDEQIVLYYLYSNNLTDQVKKVGEPLYVGLNSMAVKDGNALLLSILNKGIAHAQAVGVIDRLNQKWIGVQYPAKLNLWKLVWPYATGAGLVILLVSGWSIRLRQVVEQKTGALSASESRYRQLYEELQMREQRLNYAMKSANCGLWDWNILLNEFYYAPNYYRMAGYEPDAFPASYEEWQKRVHPEDREASEKAFDDCFTGKSDFYSTEFRFKTADGDWLWVLDKGEVVEFDEAGKPKRYIGLHVDISRQKKAEAERRELEAQIRQKYKVEAIGLMAGGMAHNFNNNLAIILGSAELALRRIDNNHAVIPLLENLRTAALRSRDLVRQVLVYSRKGVINREQIDPTAVVNETLKLLSLTLPATVRVISSMAPDCSNITIRGDANQIQDAMINLCNNAVYAMAEKGELRIAVERVIPKAEDFPSRQNPLAQEYVRISVADTGSGMADELLEKIFDPFFTTKSIHEGTGMGLATVQGVMDQHGGFIRVESATGKGTTFYLHFPAVDAFFSTTTSSPADSSVGGDECILFVDDDPMIIDVVKMMLSQAGYQVIAAIGGRDALKLFQQNPEGFDLVITDQTMPEMTGQELIEQLLQIRPDVATILCTGYSQRIDSTTAKTLGVKAFLLKPLQMQELLTSVRQVLDRMDKHL